MNSQAHATAAQIPATQSAPLQLIAPKVPKASPEGSDPYASDATDCIGSGTPSLRNRVQRVERDLHCGRPISDADLLQHSRDCTDLMHVSYGLFEAGQGERYRDEADRWKNQAQHARNCLSPEWKAAREAQIQQDIASGTGCYFTDAADRDREAVNQGSRG